MLAQPHDERRPSRQREHRHQCESDSGIHDELPLTLQRNGYAGRLHSTQYDRQIARIRRDLPASEFAFFRKLFQIRPDDRQQLQDDRRRNVGHDAQSKDRQPPKVSTREQIQESENRTLVLSKEIRKRFRIDPRRWNVRANAIDGQQRQHESDSFS